MLTKRTIYGLQDESFKSWIWKIKTVISPLLRRYNYVQLVMIKHQLIHLPRWSLYGPNIDKMMNWFFKTQFTIYGRTTGINWVKCDRTQSGSILEVELAFSQITRGYNWHRGKGDHQWKLDLSRRSFVILAIFQRGSHKFLTNYWQNLEKTSNSHLWALCKKSSSTQRIRKSVFTQ